MFKIQLFCFNGSLFSLCLYTSMHPILENKNTAKVLGLFSSAGPIMPQWVRNRATFPTNTPANKGKRYSLMTCVQACHSPNLHRHEKCTTYQPKLMSFVSAHKMLGADDWHGNICMYLGYFCIDMVGIENPFLL